MMKLYFSPGACSFASHIALHETGLQFQTERVDLKTKTTASNTNFWRTNSKGYVPALETQTGEVLTENAAVLQYIADRNPEKDLAPRMGTFERYRLQEWLNFVGTEIHKTYSLLFNPHIREDARNTAIEKLQKRFEWLDGQLQGHKFLMGSTFTVADAYLFTVLNWSGMMKVDLSRWSNLVSYVERVRSRPSVQAALRTESAK